MRNIELNSGETILIDESNNNDLVEYISDNVSRELGELILDKLNATDGSLYRQELEFNSDFRAYEMELDRLNTVKCDAIECIEKLENHIADGNRMNRQFIARELYYLKEILS